VEVRDIITGDTGSLVGF